MDALFSKLRKAETLLNFSGGQQLPVILQAEAGECGLACLAMITSYHGFSTDIISLRSRCSISMSGMSLRNLMDVAASLNLAPRALRGEPASLSQAQLPCILHWRMNHFVVLKEIRRNKFVIHDPATGERIIDAIVMSQNFTGVILELMPTASFETGNIQQELKLSSFWSKTIGLKRAAVHILVLSLLLQLFLLSFPFYMQIVVDEVLVRKDTDLLIVIALGFAMLLTLQIATKALREFIILQFSNKLSMQMATNLFRHLIRLPLTYFEKRHIGDVTSRFRSLDNVRNVLSYSLVAATVDGLMAIITLVMMFFYSVKLTVIILAIVVVYAAFRWIYFQPLKVVTEEHLVSLSKENTHFMESVTAIQTIKLFQRENERMNQWQNRLAEFMNKSIRISRLTIGYEIINSALFGIENLIVIYLAARDVITGLLSLGMLYAFMSYKENFRAAMAGLIEKWIELKTLRVHLDRIADIAYTPAEDIDKHVKGNETEMNESLIETNPAAIPQLKEIREDLSAKSDIRGKIEVRDLGFRYSEHEPFILKNISFVIEAGESVAITGPSGCGKTTLLKCLMGLIEPTEGDIFVDDVSLKSSPHYRRQIAAVMQDDQLLSGDISENICCFAPYIDLEKIIQSARRACIHDDIMKMPMQYNTLITRMGSTLSGGQKQRLVLARALYRNPRILFLDEATSHLDLGNESLVNKQINDLSITRITVAHRPETIASARREINLQGEHRFVDLPVGKT